MKLTETTFLEPNLPRVNNERDVIKRTLLKVPLLDLRQFLATEDGLKVLIGLEILSFFFLTFFCRVGTWLHKEVKINFKIFVVINWETTNYNTHNTQYHKKKTQLNNEI